MTCVVIKFLVLECNMVTCNSLVRVRHSIFFNGLAISTFLNGQRGYTRDLCTLSGYCFLY